MQVQEEHTSKLTMTGLWLMLRGSFVGAKKRADCESPKKPKIPNQSKSRDPKDRSILLPKLGAPGNASAVASPLGEIASTSKTLKSYLRVDNPAPVC